MNVQGRPRLPLQTTNLPPVTENGGFLPASSTLESPARGREMRSFLQAKLRHPLVHTWEFWHEKPAIGGNITSPSSNPTGPSFVPIPQSEEQFAPRLTNMLSISDIRGFWSLYNNFDFAALPQRSSVHLFHATIKPLWEDPRNLRGGAWTFRVPKAAATDFWREICCLAIGEQLQEAIKSDRTTFKDDICGVSFRPRFASVLITIWNRDGDHADGVQRIAETVVRNMPDHLRPKEGSYYYKKHNEHDGFDSHAAKKNEKTEKPIPANEQPRVRHERMKSKEQMDVEVQNIARLIHESHVAEGITPIDGPSPLIHFPTHPPAFLRSPISKPPNPEAQPFTPTSPEKKSDLEYETKAEPETKPETEKSDAKPDTKSDAQPELNGSPGA